MHLLIPYVLMPHHEDPMFREFTYGDSGIRARKLMRDLKPGDHIFFHTTRNGRKYITAYYVVDRVLSTKNAGSDIRIRSKYKNPHLVEWRDRGKDDAIVFGDQITSRMFEKPLHFDKKLAMKLSLGMKFPQGRSEAQTIGSATRAWRELSSKDVSTILRAVKQSERKPLSETWIRSTEEVAQVIEKDIEEIIGRNPTIFDKGEQIYKRQHIIPVGRTDLLLKNRKGELTVVEVKLNRIGRDAIQQIRNYIREYRKTDRKVKGVIVCSGVLPMFEDEIRKIRDIRILVYGWRLDVLPWK